jgi:hypothetical protein
MLASMLGAALLAVTPAAVQARPLAAQTAQDGAVYFAGEPEGIGDPNPYYENGVYSIFYLKNEGRHPWWMSQTSDLSTWSKPIEAVKVGEQGSPDVWTGSGSVIADPAGGYRLFYTGHDPNGVPTEVTMVARASSLAGPWIKDPQATFAGKPTYDQQDFRDPFVFWNPQAKAFWMVLASRQKFDAVIALYTSPDLVKWTAAAPLYSERSPLNLEVPDLFSEGDDWFIVFSDQREEYRLVRYLTAPKSDGKYEYGRFNGLDGRAFYAGRTAGTGRERLLFGWVAHKELHKDSRELVWGGDLVAHAVRRAGPGVLAVSLPDAVARQFTTERAAISPTQTLIGPATEALLAKADITVKPGDRFGVSFDAGKGGKSVLELDTAKGEAAFLYRGQGANAPRVAFPRTADGRYVVDLVIDAKLGLGVLYINRFRALSFRYYGVDKSDLALFADGGFSQLAGSVMVRAARKQSSGGSLP